MADIDRILFAKAAMTQALLRGAPAHYIIAVAMLRSQIKDDKVGDLYGPFGMSQVEFGLKGQPLGFKDTDVVNWRDQCTVFTVTVKQAWDRCVHRLGRNPSVIELYLEQWPAQLSDADRKALVEKLNTALSSTANDILSVAIDVLTDLDMLGNDAVGDANTVFKAKAPAIMHKLIQDFDGLKDFQAGGVLGNLGHECAGFTQLQQLGVPDGTGGYGWAQWTGSRRQDYMTFCSDNGLDKASDEANYGFLKFELNGKESASVPPLKAAQNLDGAVDVFCAKFERTPDDTKNLPSRVSWANNAMAAFQQVGV